MSKNKIEPKIILTICTSNNLNIPLILTDENCEILLACHTSIVHKNNYKTCELLLSKCRELIKEHNVDTIILEENKLFLDKIDKYPDPYVLQNVLLKYRINILIEQTFYKTVKYIFEIPEQEWRTKVLNKYTKYSIDLFKDHIIHKLYSQEDLDIYDKFNYYKSLCLAESVLYDSLMNVRYQINKE